MCSYQREERFKKFKEVPDPYWSDDARGFNQVLCFHSDCKSPPPLPWELSAKSS